MSPEEHRVHNFLMMALDGKKPQVLDVWRGAQMIRAARAEAFREAAREVLEHGSEHYLVLPPREKIKASDHLESIAAELRQRAEAEERGEGEG